MLLVLFLVLPIHLHIVVMYPLLFVVCIWLLNDHLIFQVALFLTLMSLFVYQVLLVFVYFHPVDALMFQSRILIHMLCHLFVVVLLYLVLKTWILIVVLFDLLLVQYLAASLIGLLLVKRHLPFPHELLLIVHLILFDITTVLLLIESFLYRTFGFVLLFQR